MSLSSPELARIIRDNPHNVSREIENLANFNLHRARFEREGRMAGAGTPCPYRLDAAAGEWWSRGYGEARLIDRQGVVIGDDLSTWDEFEVANSEALDAAEFNVIRATIASGATYHGGGGAAAAFTARLAR